MEAAHGWKWIFSAITHFKVAYASFHSYKTY